MKILITGTAGFIGFHLANRLLNEQDVEIVGLDVINDYYDLRVKYGRLAEQGFPMQDIRYGEILQSKKHENYRFIKLDLCDRAKLYKLFTDEKFDVVVNLAAQAGVRYSITNPDAYLESNIIGFYNILEASRQNKI